MRLRGSLGGGRDMAVDLGTANTLVFIRGRGIVLFEPSVVAFSEETGKVHAVGAEARRMIGRTPATIRATRPLRHGAIGANLPVADPVASMVIDIGGGTTEVAVIALGAMVVWESIRVGGYEMDEAIVDYVKGAHNLLIGLETAEAAKLAIGSAWDVEDAPTETDVAGRDLITGLLRRVTISAPEVRRALEPPFARVVTAVKDTLERTPPELADDLGVRGIVLAGGGALLRGVDERLRSEVGLPVQRVDSPLTCVAEGAGRSLDELETLERSAKAQRRARR